ncbi:MAG: hypothetical protein D6769_03510 [Methanobacteriota archaeon]|nr:MAG: hypothetical protein D6769_03510 [Euryarchaeota archaeon]
MSQPDIIVVQLVSKANANLDDVFKVVNNFKGYNVAKVTDAVLLSFVEETSVSKEPLKFFIVRFMSDKIEVIYTVSEGESPSVRQLSVFSKVLPLIEQVAALYKLPISSLISLIDTSLQEFLTKFTKDMKDVIIDNDRLRERIKQLQAKERNLEMQIKSLTGKLYETNSKLSELRLKLRKYETPSDDALNDMLIEWIKEHNGTIDIAEFSRINHIPVPRIEEALNRLVERKYIKPL